MAYEFLKKLFGKDEEGNPKALTAEELEAAIDAAKDIKVVNISEGGFVSKDKFDAKDMELKHAQSQLKEANETIKGYEGQDIETIKQSAADWEKKFNEANEKHIADMAAMERSHQKDMYFNGVKFASKAAKVGIMSEFDKQEFILKDGVFQGADAWLEQMKKDDPASFEAEKKADEDEGIEDEGMDGGDFSDEIDAGGQPEVDRSKLPKFATRTSNGSGVSPDQQKSFGFNFTGVRKRPEAK